MPEVFTKHPDTLKEILKNARSIHCAQGRPQRILTECQPENFCHIPMNDGYGEICIYDYANAHRMTQIDPRELLATNPRLKQRFCSLCGSNNHIKTNQRYHPR